MELSELPYRASDKRFQKTVEFYKSLGFEVIMQSYNEKAGKKWHFYR